jgi:hypothetical protein
MPQSDYSYIYQYKTQTHIITTQQQEAGSQNLILSAKKMIQYSQFSKRLAMILKLCLNKINFFINSLFSSFHCVNKTDPVDLVGVMG